ncbi:hypothetical protein [Paenibacillus hunanensis]|uniref:Uncharacterized protein n=1 Tax=Paenibacillus hunanensis TaxID=539262 RepID=A0ABU1IVN5_9BACL|nr:hypothetical protein [Paenibacillus hunanensis]MDR6243329.1 hypothetical protein [Paenibacillus hunanensis]GGI96951.1 hypothetical protein GCM10008022_01950 [Paenibacillus hunanensis]
MISFFRNKTIPLAEQWSKLQEAGIHLQADMDMEQVVAGNSLSWYEEKPYTHLLISLGEKVCKEDADPDCAYPSDQLWYVDLQAVENTDLYSQLAERMVAMTGGQLDITHVRSCLDHEQERVLFSFLHGGERVEWDVQYYSEWVDKSFFDRIIQLDRQRGGEREFVYMALGQHLLIAYIDQTQFKLLNKLVDPKFNVWTMKK